jgi:hypothetical protein
MTGFTTSGAPLFSVLNDTPQIATADNGVIGASGTTYDPNGNTNGQVQNTGVLTSWSSQPYLVSGGVSALALPLINDFDSTSYWGFAGGNPSQNGTAALQCCFPSLALVLGASGGAATDPPDVSKPYPLNNISCSKIPSQIISDMEADFASFANFSGSFGPFGLASAVVTFTGPVSSGATISIYNLNVFPLPNGKMATKEFNVKVEVSQVNSTAFTFTTLPGDVLYPATISFTASSSGAGLLSFTINVNGSFANLGSEIDYYGGGSSLEDHIWNHVLAQVQSDCKK